MTNKEINDFLKEIVTWFRKYRDLRPVTDNAVWDMAWDESSEIVNRYGRYDSKGDAENLWIVHLQEGLFRELMKQG